MLEKNPKAQKRDNQLQRKFNLKSDKHAPVQTLFFLI